MKKTLSDHQALSEIDAGMTIVIREVMEERLRQHKKFGEQNFPCCSEPENNPIDSTAGKRSPVRPPYAKGVCAMKSKINTLTWSDIAIEELSEIIDEDNLEHRRIEVIQLAAVCVAWAEKIDRELVTIDAEKFNQSKHAN